MLRIGLVGCSKIKGCLSAPAGKLYASRLFRKSSAYCAITYDGWFILSGLHGLLGPEQVIAPYDQSINDLGSAGRNAWATKVLGQIRALGLAQEQFWFHAGKAYYKLLSRWLNCEIPLAGLGIGQQWQWYAQNGKSA